MPFEPKRIGMLGRLSAVIGFAFLIASCFPVPSVTQDQQPVVVPDGAALVRDIVPVRFVDEAAQDPTFAAYRAQLIAAISNRDANVVSLLASRDIKLSFGGTGGREALISNLDGENPSFENYWQELKQTVTQGGQFDNIGGFTAPFTWTAEHPQDWDAFETYFVLGPPRPVFSQPNENAEVLMTLQDVAVESRWLNHTYDIPRDGGLELFRPITLRDGQTGFMRFDDLRGLVDYRAFFERRDGE